jgi:hypothetical protein
MTGCELAFPSAPFLLLVDGSPAVPPLATLPICGSEAPAKLVEMSAMAVKVFPSLKRSSDLHGVRQCHDTCLRGVPANRMLAALTNYKIAKDTTTHCEQHFPKSRLSKSWG